MVESITHVKWIRRNVFDLGGSDIRRLGRVNETPEKVEMRRYSNREYTLHEIAAMTAKQRRLERTRVKTST